MKFFVKDKLYNDKAFRDFNQLEILGLLDYIDNDKDELDRIDFRNHCSYNDKFLWYLKPSDNKHYLILDDVEQVSYELTAFGITNNNMLVAIGSDLEGNIKHFNCYIND
jgi:hypothetical protein